MWSRPSSPQLEDVYHTEDDRPKLLKRGVYRSSPENDGCHHLHVRKAKRGIPTPTFQNGRVMRPAMQTCQGLYSRKAS
jgi:hypothetical protein